MTQFGRMTAQAAAVSPTNLQVALAAGWFEGEGWCSDGSTCVQITQKDRWMVDRLLEWFGGAVWQSKKYPCYVWSITGPRARGFLMTIYLFLSPRRQDRVRKALAYKRNTMVA